MPDTSKLKDIEIKLNSVPEAIEDIKNGKIIIVVDDENRENEGDFIVAAEHATPEVVNFMAMNGRGLHCVPLTPERCEQLNLIPMVGNNTDPKGTAFTVSVDLLGHGVTTGISAYDRARTIQAIIDENTTPEQLGRPGHIFPLKAKLGGVIRRPGHTEAAVDLARLAGLKPAGLIVEIMNEDGTMARLPQLMVIAKKFDLKIISIEDLIEYRLQHESLIERIEEFPIKTIYGDYNLIAYKQKTNNQIHFALVKGEWTLEESVPVRVKSTNSYYDLFSSLQYGETPLLGKITDIIDKEGKGAIIFINNISDSELLEAKLEHFKSFHAGSQNSPLLQNDQKDFGTGAQIIKDLGIKNIQLITQHPERKRNLGMFDLEVVETIGI
ncbi:3,4-dihydroxy-2-butanone-4-phosphate synthase [Flavobacteriaceae bacterium Ap0902]|nr:3,4-dihydroxy-2-butanone-4-phosphate synthase [Flavobacteriaceae bacterium Ap0902]